MLNIGEKISALRKEKNGLKATWLNKLMLPERLLANMREVRIFLQLR